MKQIIKIVDRWSSSTNHIEKGLSSKTSKKQVQPKIKSLVNQTSKTDTS